MSVWGDVPTWVASVAAVSALGFGAVVAVYAKRAAEYAKETVEYAKNTYELEAERDRVAEASLARSQSSQVSAWWGQTVTREGSGLFLRNASEAPVYQVDATALGADDRAEILRAHLPILPPGPEPSFHLMETPVDEGGPDVAASARRVRLTFTDAAGGRWMRDPYGRLFDFKTGLVLVATDGMRADVLRKFVDEFQATYGVAVTFQEINTSISTELRPLFAAPSRDGDPVDALIGAHDWIGALAQDDLIEPMILSPERRKAFRPWTMDSLTYGGKLFGLPTTLDVTALIRNVDLAPTPPETMEDLIATGNDLRHRGRVTETLAVRVTGKGDPFQLWPLFASAGGALFGKVDGAWDLRHIELASDDSINAFERLRNLGEQGERLLRRSMDRAEAFRLFATRQTPYLISSSDGLEAARSAGVRVAVSSVPEFTGGKPARAMSLVHSLFIAKGGRSQFLAQDLFSNYLTHRNVMEELSKNVVCPVALLDTSGQDAAVGRYQEICEKSDPMPSFRGMRHVWEIVGRAQAAAIGGAFSEETARGAAKEVSLALQSARAYE